MGCRCPRRGSWTAAPPAACAGAWSARHAGGGASAQPCPRALQPPGCSPSSISSSSGRSSSAKRHICQQHNTLLAAHIKQDVDDAGVHDQVVVRDHDVIVPLAQPLPHALAPRDAVLHQRPHHLPLHGVGHAQRGGALRVWGGQGWRGGRRRGRGRGGSAGLSRRWRRQGSGAEETGSGARPSSASPLGSPSLCGFRSTQQSGPSSRGRQTPTCGPVGRARRTGA